MLTDVYAYRIVERFIGDAGDIIKQHLCLTNQGFLKPSQLLLDCMRITKKDNPSLICPVPHRDYTIYVPMYLNKDTSRTVLFSFIPQSNESNM